MAEETKSVTYIKINGSCGKVFQNITRQTITDIDTTWRQTVLTNELELSSIRNTHNKNYKYVNNKNCINVTYQYESSNQ